MVSYFGHSGRLILKSIKFRQSQNGKEVKWPLLQNFRHTFTVKSDKRSYCQKTIERNSNYAQSSHKKFYNFYSTPNQRPRNAWVKWTLFLLRLTPVGICAFAAVEWQLHKRKCEDNKTVTTASNLQAKFYRSLPLRIISRCWGWLASCYIPLLFRPYVFGLYSNMFRVNLEEALYPDYRYYNTLSEFFTRPLRDGVRQVDHTAPLVSPVDGTILHFGCASNSVIEQVKGVNYSMESFTGPLSWKNIEMGKKCNYVESIKEVKDGSTNLYQCVIYLAPGDYHRFHSPARWKPILRRHFSGELLSVNPKIAQWLPDLFCLNERVIYIGRWEYGFFSYTAVGATNVGSVQIYIDDQLKTNRWIGLNVGTHKRTEYDERKFTESIEFEKGDPVGQFNMGSTIVLIFEAPKNFQFSINSGEKIYMGTPLGFVAPS